MSESDSPLTLTGRVVIAKQMLALCGEGYDPQSFDLGAVEGDDPQPGDLKLSSSLDGRGRLAFQDGHDQCFVSGVLTASIYDGAAWRRFDLRSITPHVHYPNPTLLQSVVASVRAAAEVAAGHRCEPVDSWDGDGGPKRERAVALASRPAV